MRSQWYSDGSIRWMKFLLINYLENDDLGMMCARETAPQLDASPLLSGNSRRAGGSTSTSLSVARHLAFLVREQLGWCIAKGCQGASQAPT